MAAVKSCSRTLGVLEVFSRELRDLTLAEVARLAQSPKSSCLAILETLMENGYLYRVSDRPSYFPTRRWYEQSRRLLEHDPIGVPVREALVRIRDACGETTMHAVYAEGGSTYLDVVESNELIRFNAQVGERKPMHASASGRAQLAHMAPAARAQVLDGLRYDRTTRKAPATRHALEALLAREAPVGWSVNLGEYRPDVISVAAGYALHGSAYSLVVAGPYARVVDEADRIGRLLRREADALVKRLAR